MMRIIKAIFFDIDDTLYSTSDFARTARHNSVRAMIDTGLDMTVDECYKEYLETIEEFGPNFGQHLTKMLLRIPAKRYCGVNPAIIIAAGVVAYHKTKAKGLVPYSDVVKVFRIIHEQAVKLGIITEGLQVKQAEKLVRLDLLKYIDPMAIFITDQIGIGKSNPKLYLRACESLNLEPASCIQVGDNPRKDIDPSHKIGMITVLMRRSGKYMNLKGETERNYTVSNMWELLDILKSDFGFKSTVC